MHVFRSEKECLALLVCAILSLSGATRAEEPGRSPAEVLSGDAVEERLELGRQAMAGRKFAVARDHFHRVLQLDWNNPRVYEWWCAAKDSAEYRIRQVLMAGERKMARGIYAEALVFFHEALALDSSRADVKQKIRVAGRKIYAERYLVTGLDHFLDGEYESARDLLDSALVFDPENKTASALLTRTEARSAESVGSASLQEDPESWSTHLEALKSYRAGEYRTAIELWEKILRKYPGQPDATANIRQARLRLPAKDRDFPEIANGGQ